MEKNSIKKFWCDENKKKLEPDNQLYKDIKKIQKNCKTYLTHDNGGRPFLVYVCKAQRTIAGKAQRTLDGKASRTPAGKDKVDIYKEMEDKFYIHESDYNGNTNWMYIDLIKSYQPQKIFIGKSPLNDMTEFSGGHGPDFDGNSILLEISKNKYVFLGESIKIFNSKNKIKEYVSPVGNSDVPYPYAVDENGEYYLMIENVVVENVPDKYKDDPYVYYYGHHNDNLDMKTRKLKMTTIQKRLW